MFACNKTANTVDKVIDKAPEIARNFKTGQITQTFRESIPQISSTKGNVLELAVCQSDETFKRSDARWVGWDSIYLGTTVVEIRAPVTFRYHLRLSDTWQLASSENVCKVIAPSIRATLPPAIDTAKMEKMAENGWARSDKEDRLNELERAMTPLLEKRAMDIRHMELAREACRQSVAEFVKVWLIREDQWKTNKFTAIVVVFPDEIPIGSDQELSDLRREPVVQLSK